MVASAAGTASRNGDIVTTNIKVKNVSTAPIAHLTIAETWFDKGQAQVATRHAELTQNAA